MSKSAIVRVADVMTPQLKFIDSFATVSEAIAMMRAEDMSSLVVDRRHDDDEYGIVVVSDIAQQVIGKNLSPDRVNVYDIMTKPVLTVDVDMDIKYAIRLLIRFGLSRCLVVKSKELVGIVTLREMTLVYVDSVQGKS